MSTTKLLKGDKAGKVAEEFEDVSVIDPEFEDITDLQNDIDATLSKVSSEFDKDENDVNFKIKLHRVLEKKGEREWLFDILPSELPVMDRVRDEYGGGRYEASMFKNGKLFRKFNFNIATPRTNYVPPVKSNNDLNSIVAMLMQQQKDQMNEFKELILQVAKPAAPSNQMDIVGIMTAMAGMFKVFQGMMPQPVNNGNGIELLIKGMEVMKDVQGGNGETGLLDVVKELVKSPLIENILQQKVLTAPTAATPAAAPRIAGPAPASPGAPSISATPKTEDENMIRQKFIAGQINQLVMLAKQNKDPDLYAEVVLDNLPAFVSENDIKQVLANENIIEDMSKINPEVKNYEQWFLAFKNSVNQILNGETGEPLTDGNQDT